MPRSCEKFLELINPYICKKDGEINLKNLKMPITRYRSGIGWAWCTSSSGTGALRFSFVENKGAMYDRVYKRKERCYKNLV